MTNQEPTQNIVEGGDKEFFPSLKKVVMFGIGIALGASTLLLYRNLFANQDSTGLQEIVLEDRPGGIPFAS